MKANMGKTAKEFPARVKSAAYIEANVELIESQRLVPVRYGLLRASGMVQEPEIKGNTVSVNITYGDDQVDYAVYVHEDLEAFHPVGQAKFLEEPLKASAPYMGGRIAARLNLERKR
jgi:hypothetical protein